MKRRWLAAGALAVALSTRPAHAELGADVRALSAAYSLHGHVVRLQPRLLERGDRLPLSISPDLLSPRDSTCTTVSILGVVGLHFAVRFSELDPSAPSSAFPEPSAAGAIEITRCGSSKPYLAGVVVEMRSPRGVLETLLSNAPAGLPRLAEVLPSRDPGTELALGDPGPPPPLPPLAQRLERLATRARREGANAFQRMQWQAGDDGSGAEPLDLDAGCHELTLLAETPASGERAIDLDVELADAESGARLGVDRAEDADAALSVCLGSPAGVELRFIGAAPNASLTLTRARWDLPRGLPGTWGTEARARLAALARAQHLRLLSPPIYTSLGVQGTSELPLEVEPGACYAALVAPLRGEVRNLSLSALARAAGEVPRGTADPSGGAVSFCAHGARHVTLEVDGQGASLAWLLAVWETGRSAIGVRER